MEFLPLAPYPTPRFGRISVQFTFTSLLYVYRVENRTRKTNFYNVLIESHKNPTCTSKSPHFVWDLDVGISIFSHLKIEISQNPTKKSPHCGIKKSHKSPPHTRTHLYFKAGSTKVGRRLVDWPVIDWKSVDFSTDCEKMDRLANRLIDRLIKNRSTGDSTDRLAKNKSTDWNLSSNLRQFSIIVIRLLHQAWLAFGSLPSRKFRLAFGPGSARFPKESRENID